MALPDDACGDPPSRSPVVGAEVFEAHAVSVPTTAPRVARGRARRGRRAGILDHVAISTPILPRRRRPAARATLAALALLGRTQDAPADDATVRVRTVEALREAVATAKPGRRIRIAPGTYAGGLAFVDVRGAEGRPVVLEAEDPAKPPVFRGGTNGIQLTDAAHVELRSLVFEGATGNGLNVDDGGTPDTPTHHVVLRDLVVRDVGPDGNRDGIKLSGLLDFRVEGCTVERWGRGGSAVDMVGCQRGPIEGCVFRHTEGASDGSGVQAKGARRDVAIRRNRFEHAGSRAVNAGGSTGLAFFRPPLAAWKGPRYEAKDLVVEGNTFVGSQTPVAFVGVDGAVFRFNTVYLPGRWALRILQETREEGFVPSRGGEITANVFAFRSDRWSEGGVNASPGTEPASFRFARNVWWCVDAPDRTRSLVRLPTPEVDGTYGKDPGFVDAPAGDLRVRRGGPAAQAGADALR